MELNGFLQIFMAGCFGGLMAELLKWYGVRGNRRWPRYARTVRYWIITAIMIGGGGVLACLYGIKAVNAILAVNVGASAPLIVSSLAMTAPATSRTRGLESEKPSVLDVLTGR